MKVKKEPGIDLHIHSTASDGSLSPPQILALAQKLNLGAISITDHDTIDGSKAALSGDIPASVRFVSGIEISANPPAAFPCSGSFHILGYLMDVNHPILNQRLVNLKAARKNRNVQVVERLNRMGIPISLDEIIAQGGGGQIGRPHIARLMIKNGFSRSVTDAFDTYLGKGKPAYVDKYRMDVAQAIDTINAAGGMAVLAHPLLANLRDDKRMEELIVHLKERGLRGIEAYYPEHPAEITAEYLRIAKQHNLLVAGGTDFHGSLKPDIQMGTAKGDFFVPYCFYARMIEQNS